MTTDKPTRTLSQVARHSYISAAVRGDAQKGELALLIASPLNADPELTTALRETLLAAQQAHKAHQACAEACESEGIPESDVGNPSAWPAYDPKIMDKLRLLDYEERDEMARLEDRRKAWRKAVEVALDSSAVRATALGQVTECHENVAAAEAVLAEAATTLRRLTSLPVTRDDLGVRQAAARVQHAGASLGELAEALAKCLRHTPEPSPETVAAVAEIVGSSEATA